MREVVLENWDSLMDNRKNPLRHLDMATQHYFMQVLAWMWSMVFSLSFLSIMQFGLTWLVHVFVIGGIFMTVALFKEAERKRVLKEVPVEFGSASRCAWKLDSEA
ncbi:MAG: hypothetical protein ACPG1A_00920 [Halioglobus sp.]